MNGTAACLCRSPGAAPGAPRARGAAGFLGVSCDFRRPGPRLALAVRLGLVYHRPSVRPALVRAAKLDQGGSHVFSHIAAGLHRRFDLVRRSLLQAPGLPFADALSAEQIQHAFDAEDVALRRRR